MNKFNPKKLLNSKWTAVVPQNKERHFLLTKLELDEDGQPIACVIEAVMSKRAMAIMPGDLKDTDRWLLGWK